MDDVRDRFTAGRREMIAAFVAVSDLARRAGVDPDEITAAHGRFFDGNVEVKKVWRVVLLLAEVFGRPSPVLRQE